MSMFRRSKTDKQTDRQHDENVSDRLRTLILKDTKYEDPESVEVRLRNMNYGTSRR